MTWKAKWHLNKIAKKFKQFFTAGDHKITLSFPTIERVVSYWLKTGDVKLMINASPQVTLAAGLSHAQSLFHTQWHNHAEKLSTNRNRVRNCFRRISICKFSIFHSYSSLLFLSFHYVIDVKNPHQVVFSFLNLLSL